MSNQGKYRIVLLPLAIGAALAAPLAAAQTTAPAGPPSDVEAAAEYEDLLQQDVITSEELGQTHMDDSFGPHSHAQWVRDTRRKAWEDTKWNVQLRTFYLDREKFDDAESEAWTIGGSVGFKTGYFRERFAFGATGYTSMPLYAPEEKDGTTLLKPGQEEYFVLGEIYGEWLFNDEVRLSFGRRALDTPYINTNDNRMTPNTFQAVTLHGLHGGGESLQWRWGAGYVDEIKERNSDEFVSMAEDAGAPEGVDEGVFTAGVNLSQGPWSIGAIDYYSQDIINIFYMEGKYAFDINDRSKFTVAMQYTDETSVGDELLKGFDFDSHMWGIKGELSWDRALFTLAYTGTGGDSNMQNPWSGYPGYTSVQVEDFNRAGEEAWMLRAAYKFKNFKGASVYGLYVEGSEPDDPAQFAKNEYDLNFQWNVPDSSIFKGLMFRLRWAHVTQDDPGSSDLDDLRVMVYYDPPKL